MEEDDISDLWSSQKSLNSGLKQLTESGFLERERRGKKFVYWLSEKGKNRIQLIKKRERQRQDQEDSIFDYEDGVEEFIRYFENKDYGQEEINKASIGRNYVYLDFEQLEKFNHELADDLLDDPDRVLKACKEAVRQFSHVRTDVDVRVRNVAEIDTQSISDLSAKDLNSLVTVEGIIQSVSAPGSKMVSAVFECQQCGERFEKDQEGSNKLTSPYKCDCGSKKFDVVKEKHTTVRFLRIKEKPDKRSRKKIVAIVEGDLAEDESKNLEAIGSGIKATGYLETYKENKKNDFYNFRLKANNIEVEEDKWNISDLDEEDVERIKEVSERDDLFDFLGRSIAFEEIKNLELMKKAMLIWLLGRTERFGNLHFLAIGDPGTAKSHLAAWVNEKMHKVIKSVATGATEVGLTGSVVKDKVTGEYTAEGGSLPMADGGFHITDEVDELDQSHYSAFNEALSDQTISLDKANIHTELSADVSEFSIGNPEEYSFHSESARHKQIPIQKDDLISRYGVILAVTSNQDYRREREKARHILDRGEKESFEDEDYLDEELLVKYVTYAQSRDPELTEDAKDSIQDAYISLWEENEDYVKPRHLNALSVISIAFARMELSGKVDQHHVGKAIKFLSRCYESMDFHFGRDDFSELEGQNKDRVRQVLQVIEDLQSEGDSDAVDVENVIEEVDLTRETAEEVIENLKSKGEVWNPSPGEVKTV